MRDLYGSLPVGFQVDSLERQHLLNLAFAGEYEDEIGRDIEHRLEELTADLFIDNNEYEDRLHLAMSSDWETKWMRRSLYDHDPYDGGDIDPPAPYDYEIGKVLRFLNRNGKLVQWPRPWKFVEKDRQRWFIEDLKAMINRFQWQWTRISRNRKTKAPVNLYLEIALSLPYDYDWPNWAGGIHVYLFGDIVNTRWRQIYLHRLTKAQSSK